MFFFLERMRNCVEWMIFETDVFLTMCARKFVSDNTLHKVEKLLEHKNNGGGKY